MWHRRLVERSESAPALHGLVGTLVLVTTFLYAGDYDVGINEIHYNPLSGDDKDEFVELHNAGPTEVDVSGWEFVEGIHIEIPDGTFLPPGGFLIVSPDAAHAASRYPTAVVAGDDYTGRLDNGGEIVSLVSRTGRVISRVHYGDGGTWASEPDGLGPSLELVDPRGRVDLQWSWAASLVLDGTPGAPNSTLRESPRTEESVLVEIGDDWRYLKGVGTGLYPTGWREPDYDDAAWDTGRTGIGYGDNDDRTELDDMEEIAGVQDGYMSFAARRTFYLTQEDIDSIGELTLTVDYDDGFAAYLNGSEVARRALGEDGEEFVRERRATDNHEAGTPEPFPVAVGLLREGKNVLAAQLHNDGLSSSDASFIPRLWGQPAPTGGPTAAARYLVINEIKQTESLGQGFVELFNLSGTRVAIGGYGLVTSAGDFSSLPAGEVPANGFLQIPQSGIAFTLQLAQVTYALVEPDGKTWVDGVDPRAGLLGENGFSFGRFPDGDKADWVMRTPTPGGPNQIPPLTNLVVNEIYFHPPFVPPGGLCTRDCSDADQWIEIHNPGEDPVDMTGWSITKGITFDFPDDLTIAGEGYVVVASSRTRFLARHAVDEAIVVGDWERNLSHSTDTINLRDELGNRVDHVEYGDGKPLNDEEPWPVPDEIDDGTFRGSDWPTEADGSGKTLELRHPALDNQYGAAWVASTEPYQDNPDTSEVDEAGTPGAPNSGFEAAPLPVVGRLRHDPPVPTSSDPVTVTCRVSAAGTPFKVEMQWQVEGGGDSGTITLLDDGLSGDGAAGDGVYGGTLDPQPARSIISFQIDAFRDATNFRTYPQSPPEDPYEDGGFVGPYYLYQVLDAPIPPLGVPAYWVIMTLADELELEDRDLDSNVLLPATFIAHGPRGEWDIRYLAGVRYRGGQTRRGTPIPYRVALPRERTYLGRDRINLIGQDTDHEMVASDIFRRAALPWPRDYFVQYRFQGGMSRNYVHKEVINDDFLERFFGGSGDDGNLYRAIDPDDGPFPFQGDLEYLGDDPDDYRPYYSKRTNEEEDDYSDIIELCRIFDRDEVSDEDFPDVVAQAIDAWEWARFFAVQSCISNRDGGIWNRTGEDFFLYRVPADSARPDAGKWILIPWDIEETFDDPRERLFNQSVPAIQRLLRNDRFAPLYYCNLVELREGTYSEREVARSARLLDGWYGSARQEFYRDFAAERCAYLDEVIPRELTSGAVPATGGGTIEEGDTWRYFKGTEEPPGAPLAWTTVGYPDGDWPEGPSGLGYGDGDDATLLDDMRYIEGVQDGYTTLYIRKVFQVPDPSAVDSMELSIDYDDGFIAFLNGVEVTREDVNGAPGTFLPHDATTGGFGHDAGTPLVRDISEYLGELEPGDNVLAIQGVNVSPTSSDFSLIPELRLGSEAVSTLGCGAEVFTTLDTVRLRGTADACDTHLVRLTTPAGNQTADYDAVTARWEATVTVPPGGAVVTVKAYSALGELTETLAVRIEYLVQPFTGTGTDISGNVTWRASRSPYLLTSDAVVTPGSVLTIEPGTTILARSQAALTVRGELRASGTAALPIEFRAADCDQTWGGINFDDTGVDPGDPTHTLEHCDFEGGAGYSGRPALIDVDGSRLEVADSFFRTLNAEAIRATDSWLEVAGTSFSETEEGVRGIRSTVRVLDSTFDQTRGLISAVYLDSPGPERSAIEGNTFRHGYGDGIQINGLSADVRDNVLVGFERSGIRIEGDVTFEPGAIRRNIAYSSGVGLRFGGDVTVEETDHNTVVGNYEGVRVESAAVTFDSTILWDSSIPALVDTPSSVTFNYSDLPDDSLLGMGAGNISAEPMLASPRAMDFSLLPGSPCIRTGNAGTDIGAVPYSGPVDFFLRGDADSDGTVDGITDPIYMLDALFRGGPAPSCLDQVDSNDDGAADLSDAVYLLLHFFAGGAPPPAPYPVAGLDPTPDTLPCP